MNFRLTIGLFFGLLLLIVGVLIYSLVDDKPGTDVVLLPDLAGLKANEDIDAVEITRTEPAEETITLARTGKRRWELRSGNAGRLDEATVLRAIDAILKLKPVASNDLTDDPAKHGLDKPSLKVTLRASNQKTGTLLVGDTTLGGADRAVTFVASGDHPKTPLAVRRADLAPLFRDGAKDGSAAALARWASEYRTLKLVGADILDPSANAKSLKIQAGGKTLALSRIKGSEWKFDEPAGYGLADLAGDPGVQGGVVTGVRGLLTQVVNLSPMSTADFIENPEPLEKYGLAPNDPNLLRIELSPADGPPEVLLVGKKADGPPPVKYFAQLPGERCVVKVFGDGIDALRKTVADPRSLQDRTLVKDLDAPRIDAADVTVGGATAKLRRVYVGSLVRWVLYGGPTDPQVAGPAIQNLITELTKPRLASEALAAPADAMFAGPELKAEVKIWFEGFDEKGDPKTEAIPAEPKLKGGPSVTLLFGKTEGENAYVRRILADGTKTDFKVPASVVGFATKKRTDFFDLKFKEFATNLAKKLVFNRGTEAIEIDRSETPDVDYPTGKWVFAAPPSLKGQVAEADRVGGGSLQGADLIGTLATLSAASVAAEKPTDAELKAMGLDPASPRLKATVTLADEKDKERVFLFGTETADKSFVHFMLPGKPVVYLVPRVAVDPFLTADLRERLAYRFDPKDVKRIQLRWRKAGKVQDATFERAGDGWTAKATPPWTPAPRSVELLLNHFRAPKPLAVLGAAKPEYGLDVEKDDDAMEIKFFTDKAEIVTVKLGKETDNGASYFAAVTGNKEFEAMTLPSGLFKQFKDGPEFFKK